MSKQTPSQDFSYKFEHNWGGEDNWYTKGKRWAFKQKPPFNHLALGILEWLREKWIDGRVEMEMASVDKQTEQILKEWEEDAEKYYDQSRVQIMEDGLFGEEGWSISISNPVVEGRSEQTDGRMGTSGNEVRLGEKLPDPWDDPLM